MIALMTIQEMNFLRSVEDELNRFQLESTSDFNDDGNDEGFLNILNARITEQEILHSIKNLKSGKAPGPDGLSNEFYKYSANVILPLLAEMFNFILILGYFPLNGLLLLLY